MGNGESYLTRLRERLFSKDVRILMCGLDAAGKTTILYQLKLGEMVSAIPTIGFNVETIKYKGVNFNTWDTGGRDKSRPLLRHYYPGTDMIIWVVDSSDRDRMSECCDELWMLLGDKVLEGCCLLVLANKQDLRNAMSVEEIAEQLKLNSLQDRAWHIKGTSATNGDGLYEGLTWLQQQATGKQVKKAITQPFQETGDSVVKKSGLLSCFSALGGYCAFGRYTPVSE